MVAELDDEIGLEHVGEGEIGDAVFERFVNHDALRENPIVLETPVDEKGYAWSSEKVRSLRQVE